MSDPTMGKPVIADTKPTVLELEPGFYFWCRCGRSKKQPWCDGSHSGSGLSPLGFEITEKKRVAICNCKHTSIGPYCDGSHKKL